MKHSDALQSCQNLNATLPFPKSRKEHSQFTESFKRLGIDKKLADFSAKFVLDVRRSNQKGKASLFFSLESKVFDLYLAPERCIQK